MERVVGSLSGLRVLSVTIKIYKQIPKCHYSVAATVAVITNDPVRKRMPKFMTEGYIPHREAIFIVKKLLSIHPQLCVLLIRIFQSTKDMWPKEVDVRS